MTDKLKQRWMLGIIAAALLPLAVTACLVFAGVYAACVRASGQELEYALAWTEANVLPTLGERGFPLSPAVP